MEQIDRGETREKADGGRQDDKAPIMLSGETGNDPQHWTLCSESEFGLYRGVVSGLLS
jgi:hypothetical protein